MNTKALILLCTLALASTLGCGTSTEEEDDAASSEDEVRGLDNIGAPTDTRVTLAVGRWHDNVLTPREGWHAYHFHPQTTGYYRIVMKGAVGDATIWSYLRIEQEDPEKKKPWLHNTASVGNTRTNLCEIIMKMEAGFQYDVITTSQHNLVNPNKTRHVSDGRYTVAVLPVDSTMQIPE